MEDEIKTTKVRSHTTSTHTMITEAQKEEEKTFEAEEKIKAEEKKRTEDAEKAAEDFKLQQEAEEKRTKKPNIGFGIGD